MFSWQFPRISLFALHLLVSATSCLSLQVCLLRSLKLGQAQSFHCAFASHAAQERVHEALWCLHRMMEQLEIKPGPEPTMPIPGVWLELLRKPGPLPGDLLHLLRMSWTIKEFGLQCRITWQERLQGRFHSRFELIYTCADGLILISPYPDFFFPPNPSCQCKCLYDNKYKM